MSLQKFAVSKAYSLQHYIAHSVHIFNRSVEEAELSWDITCKTFLAQYRRQIEQLKMLPNTMHWH